MLHAMCVCVCVCVCVCIDIPLLKAGGDVLYWFCQLLQSTYACFKALRFQKLIHPNEAYFCELTQSTSECLSRLSLTTIRDEVQRVT